MTEPLAACPTCGATLAPDATHCPRCGSPVGAGAPLAPDDPAAAARAEGELEERLRAALSPNFLLVRRIGTGGMGSVYLARDPVLKRLVAVKVLAPALASNPDQRARFEREAQAVAGLSHPNVVAIFGVGELDDGTPYFVMQYVGGKSIADRIEEDGPFPVDEARRILGEVAAALAVAHAHGIIHRDIKPGNILYDDQSGRALVTDFGIAAVVRRKRSGDDSRLTKPGTSVGTPRYMSPEQLAADEVTEQTDVYALGLLGYELLTGEGPFTTTSPQELIAAQLRDTPKPVSRVRDDIDPELDALISACLAKDPARRPTAVEIARRLAPGGGVLLEWPPPGLDALHGDLFEVSRWLWAADLLLAAAFLSLIAFGPQLATTISSFSTLSLWLAGIGGVALLVIGLRRLIRLGGEAAAAVRLGFGWATVLEALADRRGDGGNLITGSREYAALDAPARARLRRGRVVSLASVLLGALLPVPLMVLWVRLGSGGLAGGDAVAPLILGPSVALLVVSAWVERRERRAVRSQRARLERGRPRVSVARLVEPWYTSFERVRQGQSMGRGPTGRAPAGRIATLGAVAVVLLCAILLAPVTIIGTFGPAIWQAVSFSRISNLRDQIRLEQTSARWGVMPDSAITPLDAGRAYFALAGAARRGAPAGFPEHPLPEVLPFDSLPGSWLAAFVANPDTLWARAERGFPPATRDTLRRVAAFAGFAALDTVARARAVDYLGARFVMPFPDSAAVERLPIPRFETTKLLINANLARAAYLLSIGRTADAERAIRELISFGLRLMDGTTLLETRLGVLAVHTGREALIEFYTVVGRRPEAHALRAAYDSLASVLQERDAATTTAALGSIPTASDEEREMIRVVLDTTAVRGLRWSMAHALALAPCTDLRSLIFGPDAELRAVFADAKRSLARYQSEGAFFDRMMHAASDGPGFRRREGVFGPVLQDAARVTGTLLGNRRLPGCTAWLVAALSRER